MSKTTATVGAAAALGGLVVAMALLAPGGAGVGLDGGATGAASAPYTLPDGGPWSIGPTALPLILGTPPSVFGQVDIATPTGYQRVSYAALADGGYTLGTTALPFVCVCADSTNTCLWPDGGVVATGTYAASAVSGAGCQLRPCVELAGFTGAAAGCVP
jgi:hypothetical protein